MNYKIFYIIFFILNCINSAGQSDSRIDNIMKVFKCSEQDAHELLSKISSSIKGLQKHLTALASRETKIADKEKSASYLLEKVFVYNATVQVSTIFGTLNSYKAREYIDRIKNLSKKYTTEVTLEFDNTQVRLSNIEKRGVGGYEFYVTVKQLFKGCSDGNCYRDTTWKNIRYTLEKGALKIQSITVVETQTF